MFNDAVNMIPGFCIRSLACLALVLVLSIPNDADAKKIDQQRQNYFAALDALRGGETTRFQELLRRQQDYILRSYLEYEYLKDRVGTTSATVLRDFLEANREAAVSDMLRRRWLVHLAERGDWKTFHQEYREVDDGMELRCHRLRHLSQAQQSAAVNKQIEQIWMTGSKLPPVCEDMLAQWGKTGHLDNERVWARIRLAMERRNVSLASELSRYLESDERIWVQRWVALHKDPARALAHINYAVETPLAREIVRHGVMRLAHRDPQIAMREWERLKEKFAFTPEDENYVLRWAGVLAAQAHLPVALEWLAAIKPAADDELARHWQVRSALHAGRWEMANYFVSALTPAEQKQAQWRYWKARALEQVGLKERATALFTELAGERDYYGFLAADRLSRPYTMQHVTLEATQAEMEAMLSRQGMQIARELFEIGETALARRQWTFATRGMSNRELQLASVAAGNWGWYDRAILTLSKTDHLDDLELRFPIIYREMIEENAKTNSIDPGWVYGVMRQESAFVMDARSHAGALGLMQLMPQTARFVGRALNLKLANNDAILKIENNVRLGAHYLKNVLDRNQGHHALATAAYNAGPNRLKGWLPQKDGLEADVWADTIPFTETRNYVKNVMAFTTVYDHRLGYNTKRLAQRMPVVQPLD